MCGNGPLEFSGTLIGGMTQSLFCLRSPLADELRWCFRENRMILGCDSQTLDSSSSTWGKHKYNLCQNTVGRDLAICKMDLNNRFASFH